MIKHPELGYYVCNNEYFSSKIKACIYATQHKKDLEWRFNNEVFDSFPWHIEPTETLDELYDKRARELREKYDYILLAFSGGGDSNNVLESFLRQNLFIDEIVVNVMDDRNKLTVIDRSVMNNWNESAEFKLQTIPRLNEVKKLSPNTKISIVDLSNYIFEFFTSFNDAGWLDYTRERLNVSGLMRHNFLHFKEIRKRFDKDKKIAMILGIEKPRTFIKDGKFGLYFSDKAVNIATVEEFVDDYSNTSIEYFYWHPDCAKMIAKQAHVIKRFLEMFPQQKKNWTPNNIQDMFAKHRTVHERVLRPLLYSNWKESYWQSEKSTLDWYSEIDNWFLRDYKDTKEFRIWKAGLDHVAKYASDWMLTDPANPGLRGFTKHYWVGYMSDSNLN
jgi:hypothetical protein